jgi:hypothetical protein
MSQELPLAEVQTANLSKSIPCQKTVGSLQAENKPNNWPNLIVGSTSSTQGTLRLEVTGNVKCRSTDWIKKRIVVRPLQLYCHSYVIHLNFSCQNQISCVRHCKQILSKQLFIIVPNFPFNLLARGSDKNCLRTQTELPSRPLPRPSLKRLSNWCMPKASDYFFYRGSEERSGHNT